MNAPQHLPYEAADHLVPWSLESGPVLITVHPPAEAPAWWPVDERWVGRWLWRVAFLPLQGQTMRMEEAIDQAGAAALAWLEASARAYQIDLDGQRPRIEWYEGRANVSTLWSSPARRPMVANDGPAGWIWALQGINGWEARDRHLATEGLARTEAVKDALGAVQADIKHLKAVLMRVELAKEAGGDLYELWKGSS